MSTAPTLAPADALETVSSGIQAALDLLDARTATAAAALGPTAMTGEETRRFLRELALTSPAVIDATAVSKDGVMLTVEPAAYAMVEGSDISDQEQVQRLRTTQEPVMSAIFPTVEGVNATDLEHPVFALSGEFNGSASLLFSPATLLEIAVQEALANRTVDVFVLDTSGFILYDTDATGIGGNVFSDPFSVNNAGLLAVMKEIQTAPEGTGNYTFLQPGTGTTVRKEVRWTSVGLHGTDWRVVTANAAPVA
ncbi:MAG: hypothetical protein GXY82_03650 [Methanospirillum sp.]|nr:hypothetical protein [Methanospirillum sp.]